MSTEAHRVKFTYRDYLNTPDDIRYQLINGELIREPAPTTPHQSVLLNLAVLLGSFTRRQGLGKLFVAPTDVYLSDLDVVQPDLLFVSAARAAIITERNIQGPPDLVNEIASPSTAQRDRSVKLKLYARYGVAEYWIVDPAAETVETLRLEDGELAAIRRYMRKGSFTTPLLPGLRISVGEIFG